MKNFSKFLCVSLLAAGLWSCSSEEPLVPDTETPNTPVFTGDQAAMTINILGPSNGTRAVEDDKDQDGTYEDGSGSENSVQTLNFYFYDNAGEFATAVTNVSLSPYNGSTGDPFVEKVGQTKIILTGLTGKNYPSYMVAVLNGGDDATDLKGKSLSDLKEALREPNPWAGADGSETNFVMTSATHNRNDRNGYWFATPLTESNFAEMAGTEKPGDSWDGINDENAVAVDLYVERLASKVELSFPTSYQLSNGYYEMTLPGDFNIDGEMQKIKMRVLGWNLNGTAKSTKYFKEVDNSFRTTDGWDYSGTYRSYWAKTPNYGDNSYPSSFEDVDKKYNGSGTTVDNLAGIDAQAEKLTYINWNQVKNNGLTRLYKYVRPHTDRGDNIVADGTLIHGGVTEVLIAAQIVDAAGNPLSLYQLGMQFFTKDKIKGHILHSIADLNIWKKIDPATNEGKTARQIEETDLDLEFVFDGSFKLKFSTAGAATTWYTNSECSAEAKWESGDKVLEYINSHLPENQTYGYEQGRMYYNIPIEHLRGFGPDNKIMTGTYGVVRNHWYKVEVTGIKNLGHSVYRPEEDIIPPSNDTRFMIGSSVKILSWRIVSQKTEL